MLVMVFKTLKRSHQALVGIAARFGHSAMKYRRSIGRYGVRSRFRTAFRKRRAGPTKRSRRQRHRKRSINLKKKNFRRARKRGDVRRFTHHAIYSIGTSFG